MKDFVDLCLFPKEKLDFIEAFEMPVLGVISGCDSSSSLEQALLRNRGIHHDATGKWPRVMVFGANDDPGFVLFNANWEDSSLLNRFLLDECEKYDLSGYVVGAVGGEAFHNNLTKTKAEVLPTWDRTIESLSPWFNALRPGFEIKGYFDRSVFFVEQKLREHERRTGGK